MTGTQTAVTSQHVIMTSRQTATLDPMTSFPNSSPALYSSGFSLGKPTGNGKATTMLSDMRMFPSEKRKRKTNGKKIDQGAVRPGVFQTKSLSIEDSWSPDFVLSDKCGQGDMSAVIRSTTRLHDPETWRQLSRVQQLTIEDEDNTVETIPPEIYGLHSLRVLTIRWSGLKSIAPELAEMQLTQLHLTNNNLQTVYLASMKTLTVLNLAGNAIQNLPDDIGELSFLRELNVAGNQLSDLPDSIGDLSMLNELILTSNKLTRLPKTIGCLGELSSLDVSLNKLKSLPKEIGSLGKLLTLILSHNKLSSFPETLSGLVQLKYLFVRKNKFTEVPKVVSLLPNVEVINMNENSITKMAAPVLHLKHLLLDGNKLKHMPEDILACENLQTLSLEKNNISKLPGDIHRLVRLRSLHLGGNQFVELPADVGDLQELRHLTLNDNEIEHLPSKVESLRRLSVLNLDNTHIDGAWMYAYRQGIPAVLEYARSIRYQDTAKKKSEAPAVVPRNKDKRRATDSMVRESSIASPGNDDKRLSTASMAKESPTAGPNDDDTRSATVDKDSERPKPSPRNNDKRATSASMGNEKLTDSPRNDDIEVDTPSRKIDRSESLGGLRVDAHIHNNGQLRNPEKRKPPVIPRNKRNTAPPSTNGALMRVSLHGKPVEEISPPNCSPLPLRGID